MISVGVDEWKLQLPRVSVCPLAASMCGIRNFIFLESELALFKTLDWLFGFLIDQPVLQSDSSKKIFFFFLWSWGDGDSLELECGIWMIFFSFVTYNYFFVMESDEEVLIFLVFELVDCFIILFCICEFIDMRCQVIFVCSCRHILAKSYNDYWLDNQTVGWRPSDKDNNRNVT